MKRYLVCLMMVLALPAQAQTWNKIGQGELHKLFWHVYDSTLYASGKRYDASKPHALENVYHVEIEKTDLIERTFEEMAYHVNVTPAQQKKWQKFLEKSWRNVKEGDRIRAEAFPPGKLVFYVNGKRTGMLQDVAFMRAFMAIWLGEKTSEPQLRAVLLGK
jgi:hypothetical protein